MQPAGRTIVITGASSGAGRAAARAFAEQHAFVVLAARNAAALEEVATECREAGAEVLAVATDVSDPVSVSALAAKAREWKGSLDVWVNNAGVLAAGEFEATPLEVHRQVILTNLLGYIHGAHAVIPFFKEQQYGILINNISIGGFLPVPYATAYTASKFGLRGFSEALRGELVTWPDIHICDLFPAFLNSPGILHAANYTGKVLKAAPPVYDPVEVARAMVRTAMHPSRTRYIGAVSPFFRIGHALFPQRMTNVTGKVMRKYFQQAEPAAGTPGNVLNTVDAEMTVYGRTDERRMTRKLNMLTGMVLLTGIGLAVLAIKARYRRH